MKVLGLDSAGAGCSAALWADGEILAARHHRAERGQAEWLLPAIAAVLDEAGLAAGAVDRWAVTVGPGAFTGLRIGLAAARGLALATGRPALGITSFEAVAHGLAPAWRQGRTLVVVIESRRAELFLQGFDPLARALAPPLMLTPEAAVAGLPPGPLLLAGDGAHRLRPLLATREALVWADAEGDPSGVDARVVARLGGERPLAAALPPRPLYLRAPDVTLAPTRPRPETGRP
jgi:tRNA threonylcarbamoyladenosine biosynthesis protein TsaB